MKSMLVWFTRFLSALIASSGAHATTITYYHNDLLGSPIVATNSSGQVIWRESYRPFGERLTNSPASSANDVWYTSRRQDADTGLVYMGARYYDPIVGRFNSTDPVGFSDTNINTFNRYGYANNNPYRFTDPSGRTGALATAAGGAEIGTFVCGPVCTVIGGVAGFGLGVWGTKKAADWILSESEAGNTKPADKPTADLPKPEGIPGHWEELPTKGEGGRQWVNPDNQGDRVRVMPGDPDSPHASQQRPYVRDVRSGNQWLDTSGNRIEGKDGRNSPDTHIPLDDYKFNP